MKITGFRQKQDPTRISKGTNHNSGHSRSSPQGVPRIEVTGPTTDAGTTGRSSTLTESSAQAPNRVTLAPPKDLRVLPNHHHPPTPQLPLAATTTPPVGASRRSSVVGVSHSITAGSSSFRKRGSVGGIGLRSRTSSMHQSRRSRLTGNIEQLPFVVRWIIGKDLLRLSI